MSCSLRVSSFYFDFNLVSCRNMTILSACFPTIFLRKNADLKIWRYSLIVKPPFFLAYIKFKSTFNRRNKRHVLNHKSLQSLRALLQVGSQKTIFTPESNMHSKTNHIYRYLFLSAMKKNENNDKLQIKLIWAKRREEEKRSRNARIASNKPTNQGKVTELWSEMRFHI